LDRQGIATSWEGWTAGEDQAGKEWTGDNLSKPIHLSTIFAKKFSIGSSVVLSQEVTRATIRSLVDRLSIDFVSLSSGDFVFRFPVRSTED
jgi:hypothetical protein